MPPAHTTTKGWSDHLSYPSSPTPGHTPTLTPYKEPAHHPRQGVSKGNCYLFSLTPAAAGAPVKPCLNFLPGLLSISIDWGRPRTLVGNTRTGSQDIMMTVQMWIRISALFCCVGRPDAQKHSHQYKNLALASTGGVHAG